MGLVLDSDQTLLRNSALDFARGRLPIANLRKLRDTGDATGFDRDAWKEMAELGWTGMLIPEELGGNGFGYFGLGLVTEALGRTLAASPIFSTVVLSGTALALAAEHAEARALLEQVATGSIVLALAAEESPLHRPTNVTTTARRRGAGYVLNGSKRFVVDGHDADKLLVVARTSGAVDDAAGISLFIVAADARGVSRRRLSMADSRNSADIDLDDVEVGAGAMIGAEGAAGPLLERVYDRARILLAAEMFGMTQELFETTLAYLKQRTQFGVLIGTFQALKHRAVYMYTELELSKSVLYEALTALDEGRDADVAPLASVCKARLNDALQLISNEAVQMHGGIGMTDNIDVGLFLKRARVAQVMLGNAAFHRDRYAALQGF